MERELAVAVVLLVQSALYLCHRLPTSDLGRNLARSGLALDSSEYYNLASTPNIAAPLVSPSLPQLTPLSEAVPISTSDISMHSNLLSHPDLYTDSTAHKHRRKIPISTFYDNDWTLRRKFPNKKHLVEIVPLRRKTSIGKRKGKALAYILPKSKKVKKISELNENTEENSSVSDSSDQKDSSYFQNSFSIESSSLEDYDPYNTVSHHDKKLAESHTLTGSNFYQKPGSEDITKTKINDLVQYIKESDKQTLDKLIHDLVPGTEDPDLHVHYIIHNHKHYPHGHDYNSIDESNVISTKHSINSASHKHSAHGTHHIVSEILEPKENLSGDNVIDELNTNDDTIIRHNNFSNHKNIDQTESAEFRDLHYVLETTNQEPVFVPGIITVNQEPYPEVIIHTPQFPNPYDINNHILDRDLAPQYISHMPGHNIIEHSHNLIRHKSYNEPDAAVHHLIDLYPETTNSYNNENNYFVNDRNPDVINHEILSPDETNQNLPHVYDNSGNHKDNELFIKPSLESNSDSSYSETKEESSSSSSSDDNVALIPETSGSETVESDSSNLSYSSSKSEEIIENSTTEEESGDIYDENSNMILMPEDIVPDKDYVTSEESLSNEGNSDENEIKINGNSGLIPVKHPRHESVSNCVKVKEHIKGCTKHKFYKLTFLFNR